MALTLLDYGDTKAFGETIGKPRKLAWPVSLYRVTLPQVSRDGRKINPFERVVLKLIDSGVSCDVESLAEDTCLPKALVQCVLLRLQDQGFIDENNRIIKQGRDAWTNDERHPRQFVTACVFRELATGRILPHVQFLNESPITRKEKDKRDYKIISERKGHRDKKPTPLEVINALRGMHRRAIGSGHEFSRIPVELITIVGDAEVYYLDCPIAILKGDGDYRIADPFGVGFSLILENSFGSLLEDESMCDWLMRWKGSSSNQRDSGPSEFSRDSYDNDANRAAYPNLLSNLSLQPGRRNRSVEQLYGALEWALFYSCAQRPYGSAVQQLQLTAQSAHPSLLQQAAEDLGLESPVGGFYPVREGKLNDFLSGKAEMGTLISLSLLMATRDMSHPLRGLATAHPNLMLRFLEVKNHRDESGHGGGRSRSMDIELPDDAFVRAVVAALLPTVRISAAPVSATDREAATDLLMNARTSIQQEFGFALFNRLGSNLQDRLIVAEQFWLSCSDGDDALAFVCDLYAALQAAFRKVLFGVSPPDIGELGYISTAERNAKESELGNLSRPLTTVKLSAVRETLIGNDQTLQSCVVAFLMVSPAETLNALAQMQPSFIADVTLIIERRGHGNEPLPLSKEDIGRLRKSAYTTIKSLLEA